jgi:hypothetical protein
MKKLLVVLLSLGLIAAFSMTASAADVKFGGSYYVVGAYENNAALSDNGYSHAFFWQRVRLQPVFQIAEGLTFTARMDALEKQWGNTNWKTGYDDTTSSRNVNSSQKIQESIEFERAYVTFLTGIGQFQVGYQNVDDWGTDFGNYSKSRPRIMYLTKVGNLILVANYEKVYDNDSSNSMKAKAVDADDNTYALSAIFKDKGVETGLLYKYYVTNHNRPGATMNIAAVPAIGLPATKITTAYSSQVTQLSPYIKLTSGPLYLEGEATYWFGKAAKFENPSAVSPAIMALKDKDLSAWSLYLKAQMNAGKAYFGGLFSYASGDDLSDSEKVTTAPSGGGVIQNPALILLSDDFNSWSGGNGAASPAVAESAASVLNAIVPGISTTDMVSKNVVTSDKRNTIIYNAYAGFNPSAKLNIEAAFTYATVAEKALYKNPLTNTVVEAGSDKLGTEFDIKATYKIYENLSYMIGAGYLWTGDYFKGASTSATLSNDYVVLNKLTLSF